MELKNISRFRSQIYGFSIIWIMLFHAKAILDLRYDNLCKYLRPIDAVLRWGNIGVDIFLFLSGICLYFSFQKTRDLAKYSKNRALRLFLPTIIIDGWYWLVFIGIIENNPYAVIRRLSLLSFWISGDQMIWFVSLMVVLYTVYPYLYTFLFSSNNKTSHIVVKTAVLIGAVILLNKSIHVGFPERWSDYEIALTRIPVFIAGAFAGKYVYNSKKLPKWVYLLSVGVVIMGIYTIYSGVFHGVILRYQSGLMGIAITFLLEFVFTHFKWDAIYRLLAFLGSMSLELYLSHILMIHLYRRSIFSTEKRLLEYFLLLGFAVIIAYLVSRICNHVKHKIRL